MRPTRSELLGQTEWNRILQNSPRNVQLLLTTWNLTLPAAQERMQVGTTMLAGQAGGHHLVAFRPDWSTWPTQKISNPANRSIFTCLKCLRIGSGDFGRACQGTTARNVSALRKRWKELRKTKKNCKMLLDIWQLTKDEVDKKLGLNKDHNPNKARRIGEAKNPGPRSQRRMTSLLFVTINVQGATNAWAALDYFQTPTEATVIGLQETHLAPNAWVAFQRNAWKRGFQAYHQAGQASTGRWGQPTTAGGVVLLVSKQLPQTQTFAESSVSSQIVAVQVGGAHVACCYAPPDRDGDNQAELCSLVTNWQQQAVTDQAQPWVMLGDFNEEPEGPRIGTHTSAFGGTALTLGRATRWEGKRELDYLISNRPLEFDKAYHLDYHLSDHIPVAIRWSHMVRESAKGVLAKTKDFTQPIGVTAQQWRDELSAAWNQTEGAAAFLQEIQEPATSGHVQRHWNQFQTRLNQTFQKAMAKVAQAPVAEATRQDARTKAGTKGTKGQAAKHSWHQWCHRGSFFFFLLVVYERQP